MKLDQQLLRQVELAELAKEVHHTLLGLHDDDCGFLKRECFHTVVVDRGDGRALSRSAKSSLKFYEDSIT